MWRTVATARIIAGDHRRLIKCKELMESNLGKWEGLTFDEIREQFPQAMKRWVKSPMTFNAPAGEKLKSLQKRVRRFLKRIGSDNHSGKTVIVVTHSGPIRVILGEAKGRGLNDFWTTEPKTGCCLSVNFTAEAQRKR
ncbi:MAG: histidine phosphatase family protein [Planctomycetes bacterium]|nr:histidine phosphatase family protein [Planctomycetota bacterium]